MPEPQLEYLAEYEIELWIQTGMEAIDHYLTNHALFMDYLNQQEDSMTAYHDRLEAGAYLAEAEAPAEDAPAEDIPFVPEPEPAPEPPAEPAAPAEEPIVEDANPE